MNPCSFDWELTRQNLYCENRLYWVNLGLWR